ncbi:MAG: DUF748 domain-containing protein [Lentisphaeria bacterium]|nr:DUF748 domain-containing protein [Lentisphaeria bacterium]
MKRSEWGERLKRLARSRGAKRLGWVLLSLFVLFNLTVFLVLPPIVRSVAARKASEALSRPVAIGRVFINPYALSVRMDGLRVGERGGAGQFVSVRSVYVNVQLASLWKDGPVISALHVDDPVIRIVRTDPATFNFSDLLAPGWPELFSIDDIQVRNGEIVIVDDTTGTTHRLDRIRLSVPSVSNFPELVEADVQPAFSARLDGSPVGLTGCTRPFADSLKTTLDLDLKDLELTRYMRDLPVPVNFQVVSGRLDCRLRLSYVQPGGAAPSLGVTGDLELTDLRIQDKAGQPVLRLPELRLQQPILSLGALNVEGIAASFPPAVLSVDEMVLVRPRVCATVNKDGSLNLAAALAASKPAAAGGPVPPPPSPAPAPTPAPVPSPAPAPAARAPLPVVKVTKVTVQEGSVEFLDRSVIPNYRTTLDGVEASAQGFSLDPEKQREPTQFAFKARFNRQSPVAVSGRLRPNPESLLVNVLIDFQDAQLSPLTPYSGKYLGYAVEKGWLRLDLRYQVQGAKLEARNRMIIDQLTLGDSVDSPTATNLPVKFLIGLLKDRNGRITLDVPLTGNLDDPQFRLMPIVLQALVNQLERAVTSPFAFLTGRPETGFVEFDFGSAALTPEATERLEAIAKVLADRPALRFEVRPQTVSGPDSEALRRQFLDDMVRARKRSETVGQVGQSIPLSEVQVMPEEYERFLRLAYNAVDIPGKPRNFLGVARSIPVAEMEKLMLAGISVTPDDLRRLAYRRAAKVRDLLLAAKAAEAGQILLVEPEQVAAEDPGAPRPQARFEFQLAEGGAPGADRDFNAPADGDEQERLPQERHTVRNILLYGLGGAAVVAVVLLLF